MIGYGMILFWLNAGISAVNAGLYADRHHWYVLSAAIFNSFCALFCLTYVMKEWR